MQIITNHHEREFIYWHDLTGAEQNEMSLHDEGDTFFRYRGNVYALSDFVHVREDLFPGTWNGAKPDSYFSGVLIDLSEDGETFKVATYIT